MAWIEVHQSLLTHRKTLRLCRLLKMDKYAVTGRLMALWCWALDNAPDGVLPVSDIDILADVMGWDGDPQDLIDALIAAGFIDRPLSIHDWEDYAGKLIEHRRADAARQKSWRDRKKENTSPLRNEDVTVTSPLRNGATVPNPTLPYVTANTTVSSSGDIDIKPREIAPSSRKTRSSVRPPSRKTKKSTQKEKTPPPPRPRNEIWDAVVAAIGYEPKTRTECSNWGKVCAELKEAGATSEEVSVRVARYIRRYGRGMLTVNALLTHWGECEIDVPIAQNGRLGGLSDAEAQHLAAQEREAAQNRKEAEFQRRYEAAMLYAADE